MSADVESLAEPLRSHVRTLLAQAGGAVTVLSARRTRDEQIALRRANCGSTEYDIFQRPSGECHPETAKPGDSKHERGEAVDLAGDLELAAKLGAPLGLGRPLKDEPWHFEQVANFGSGGLVGAATDKVSDAASAVESPLEAGAHFAELLTRKQTWVRVAGVAVGLVALVAGLGLIANDLGAVPNLGGQLSAADLVAAV